MTFFIFIADQIAIRTNLHSCWRGRAHSRTTHSYRNGSSSFQLEGKERGSFFWLSRTPPVSSFTTRNFSAPVGESKIFSTEWVFMSVSRTYGEEEEEGGRLLTQINTRGWREMHRAVGLITYSHSRTQHENISLFVLSSICFLINLIGFNIYFVLLYLSIFTFPLPK